MPSQAALARGQAVGQGIIEAHQAANGGKLPETVAVSALHAGMDLKYSSIDFSARNWPAHAVFRMQRAQCSSEVVCFGRLLAMPYSACATVAPPLLKELLGSFMAWVLKKLVPEVRELPPLVASCKDTRFH